MTWHSLKAGCFEETLFNTFATSQWFPRTKCRGNPTLHLLVLDSLFFPLITNSRSRRVTRDLKILRNSQSSRSANVGYLPPWHVFVHKKGSPGNQICGSHSVQKMFQTKHNEKHKRMHNCITSEWYSKWAKRNCKWWFLFIYETNWNFLKVSNTSHASPGEWMMQSWPQSWLHRCHKRIPNKSSLSTPKVFTHCHICND